MILWGGTRRMLAVFDLSTLEIRALVCGGAPLKLFESEKRDTEVE
jgi:hypothetical protein